MSTTEPKAGEWWWVERRGQIVPARRRENAPGWYVFGEPHETWNVGPIARIPDPPAPEPTEAEKIDARRAATIYGIVGGREDLIVRLIRQSDEAAGYVLVPTSGPGFERMVDTMRRAGDRAVPVAYDDLLRAALESLKETGR